MAESYVVLHSYVVLSSNYGLQRHLQVPTDFEVSVFDYVVPSIKHIFNKCCNN